MMYKVVVNMDNQTLQDKFKYHALTALCALKRGDRETYLAHLKIANGLKKELDIIKKEKEENKPKR